MNLYVYFWKGWGGARQMGEEKNHLKKKKEKKIKKIRKNPQKTKI